MLKILIADDNARVRQMVRQALASLGGKVYEAREGGEAIDVCAAERPDWVLMDLRMKPIDGLRATAQIKARFPETHVVIVTNYDEAELRAEAIRVGACAYVLKENLTRLPAILLGGLPAQNGSYPTGTAEKLAKAPDHTLAALDLSSLEPNKSTENTKRTT